MALEHQTTVKSWFQRGDRPNAAQFSSFIESAMPEWQIDTAIQVGSGAVGVLDILSSVSATTHVPGAVGLQVLQAGTTAAAQSILNIVTASAGSVDFQLGITGSVVRNVNRKLSDIYSVRDFGAVGNGTTNDTAFFLAALAACDTTAASLYVPGGTYRLEGAITASGRSFHIFGDGAGISILRWTASATSEGFVFRSSGNTASDFAHVNDITFMTADQSAGTGITLDYRAQVSVSGSTAGQDRTILDRISPRFLIDNCNFVGSTPATDGGWGTAIDINCAMNGVIRDCSFIGALGSANSGNGNPYPLSETAISIHGAGDSYQNGHPAAFDIGGNKVWYYRNAFVVSQSEGAYVHNNVAVAVGYAGVFTGSTSAPHSTVPYMTFVDNDIAVFHAGVLATDVTDVRIRGNEMFPRSESSAAGIFGVVLRSTNGVASDASIYENAFHNLASRPFAPIVTEGARRVTIGNNIFDGVSQAINLGANGAGVASQQCIVDHQNIFQNTTSRYTVTSAVGNFIACEVSAAEIGHMDTASAVQIRWGSEVVSGGGASTIRWSQPFKSAAYSVVLTNGDALQGRDWLFSLESYNAAGAIVNAVHASSGDVAAATIRVNYVAFGA